MKRFPVVREFGGTPIGFMEIKEDMLPKDGNWCMAIGGIIDLDINGARPGDIPSKPIEGDFKLMEIRISTDVEYAAYLKQVGVL